MSSQIMKHLIQSVEDSIITTKECGIRLLREIINCGDDLVIASNVTSPIVKSLIELCTTEHRMFSLLTDMSRVAEISLIICKIADWEILFCEDPQRACELLSSCVNSCDNIPLLLLDSPIQCVPAWLLGTPLPSNHAFMALQLINLLLNNNPNQRTNAVGSVAQNAPLLVQFKSGAFCATEPKRYYFFNFPLFFNL